MKSSKSISTLMIFSLFVFQLGTLPISASNAPYYDFSLTKVDCPNKPCNTTSYSTSTFDIGREVTIKGWQDTTTSTDAYVLNKLPKTHWS